MASKPISDRSTGVIPQETLPHVPAIARTFARYSRESLEAFIAIAIELIDAIDGDPDNEEDDPAGVIDEDGVNTVVPGAHCGMKVAFGAGCPISDPGEYEYRRMDETVGDDPSWQLPISKI